MTKISVSTLQDNKNVVILSSMAEDQKQNDNKHEIKRLSNELEYARLRIISLETFKSRSEKSLVPNSQKDKAKSPLYWLGEALCTVWCDSTGLLRSSGTRRQDQYCSLGGFTVGKRYKRYNARPGNKKVVPGDERSDG